MNDEYKTKDLGEASALTSKSAKILRLEQGSNFYWFVFEDKNFCQQLSNSYWSNELNVSAKTYSDAMRSLKDRLFARK